MHFTIAKEEEECPQKLMGTVGAASKQLTGGGGDPLFGRSALFYSAFLYNCIHGVAG